MNRSPQVLVTADQIQVRKGDDAVKKIVQRLGKVRFHLYIGARDPPPKDLVQRIRQPTPKHCTTDVWWTTDQALDP